MRHEERLMTGCLLTRAGLRPPPADPRLPGRVSGPPRARATLPAGIGERVWLLCPVRVSAEDIAGESDRPHAAWLAREVRVTPGRLAAVVALDAVRRSRPAAAAGSPGRVAAPPGTGVGCGTAVVPARS